MSVIRAVLSRPDVSQPWGEISEKSESGRKASHRARMYNEEGGGGGGLGEPRVGGYRVRALGKGGTVGLSGFQGRNGSDDLVESEGGQREARRKTRLGGRTSRQIRNRRRGSS